MGGVLSRTGRGDRQLNRHSTPERSASRDRSDAPPRRSQSDKVLAARSRSNKNMQIEQLRRGLTEGRRFYDDAAISTTRSPQSLQHDNFQRSASWQMSKQSRESPEPVPARRTSAGPVGAIKMEENGLKRPYQREMGRNQARAEADLSDEGESEVPVQALAPLEEGHIRQIGFIERWQRGNLIGSGSYGKVYLGMNLDSGELFVVKQVVFMPKEQNEDVMQLEQEIALLATLDHENIVKYLGTERNNITNELSIFLEHMPGGSVADLVKRFGALDESVIRKYTREVLEGLLYLHNKGIIHRDIKGQNILVDNRGVCKLADFGASRHLQTTNSAANLSFKGTPVFMSPEVIMEQRYSKKSDVWSVGCTVLQMATGNPPFSEFSNHIAALFHITSTTDPPPLPANLSEEGKDFTQSCFIRDPLERPFVENLRKHPFCRKPSLKNSEAGSEQSPTSASPTGKKDGAGGSLSLGPAPSATGGQIGDDQEEWKQFKIQMSEYKVIARLKRDRSHGDKSAMSDATSSYSRDGFGGARTDGYDGADEDDLKLHKLKAQPRAAQPTRRSSQRRGKKGDGEGSGSESDGSAESKPDSPWTGLDQSIASRSVNPTPSPQNTKDARPPSSSPSAGALGPSPG